MNQVSQYTLKALHKLYAKVFSTKTLPRPECIQDADMASAIIREKLTSDEPCMITRFGAFEINILINYLSIIKGHHSVWKYIKGEELGWWWNLNHLHKHAGAFPQTVEKIEQFCKLVTRDIPLVDVLGSWLPEEYYFEKELKNSAKIDFELLNPYFSKIPWTKILENKKVLVVHPFTESIEKQYQKRELLFENKQILPKFELKTIKAVFGLGINNSFTDWFEALDYMREEIDKVNFDICLLGCGAYGFPLAAHIKRSGRKAVHMGGNLQLLFGLRGKRWEDSNYDKQYVYSTLMNQHWIRANANEIPKQVKIEGGCYW